MSKKEEEISLETIYKDLDNALSSESKSLDSTFKKFRQYTFYILSLIYLLLTIYLAYRYLVIDEDQTNSAYFLSGSIFMLINFVILVIGAYTLTKNEPKG